MCSLHQSMMACAFDPVHANSARGTMTALDRLAPDARPLVPMMQASCTAGC